MILQGLYKIFAIYSYSSSEILRNRFQLLVDAQNIIIWLSFREWYLIVLSNDPIKNMYMFDDGLQQSIISSSFN